MLKVRHITQEIPEQVREPINFWQGKTPCWEICHCPENIKSQCPASKYISLPCWAIEGTYLKLNDDGYKGDDISICLVCRVYKKYGEGKPIRIRLRDRGLDTYCRSLKEKCSEAKERMIAEETKKKGLFGGMKHLLGKVVRVEENWILKSEDWPYLWDKR